MKVYRLGPPLSPDFHRDPLTPQVEQYFTEGAFYAVGTKELALKWEDMSPDFENRPLFEIELKDTSVVMFYQGWTRTEKVAVDLIETSYTDFGEGPILDLEECQLVVKLDDIVSVIELRKEETLCY